MAIASLVVTIASLALAGAAILHATKIAEQRRECDRLYGRYTHLKELREEVVSAIAKVPVPIYANGPMPEYTAVAHAIRQVAPDGHQLGFDVSGVRNTGLKLMAYLQRQLQIDGYLDLVTSAQAAAMMVVRYESALQLIARQVNREINAATKAHQKQCLDRP